MLTSARMIPIAISSSEAQYIRKLLQSQQKGKNVKHNFSDNHLRHPRKINKSDVTPASSKNAFNISKEYQIIYKNNNPTPKSVKKDKTSTIKDDINKYPEKKKKTNNDTIKVKPRGPPQGFFNREKFKQILTSNLRTDRDHSKGENWSKT